MIEVRVAGLWRRGRALLLAEHEKHGERYWVLPGGHVKRGETLEEALVREFAEEVGVDVRVGDLVLVDDFIGAGRHVIDLYFAVEPADAAAEPRSIEDGALRGVRFVDTDAFATIDVRPPIGDALAEYVRTGRPPRTYLGRP